MPWTCLLPLVVVLACAAACAPATQTRADADASLTAPSAVAASAVPPSARDEAPLADENDPRWHDLVGEIVAGFPEWMRVDDAMRWAPELCHLPLVRARVSEADARTPHGRKLYTLWAKDAQAYGARPTADLWVSDSEQARRLAPLEQALVKQAFVPRELETPPPGELPVLLFEPTLGPVERDGRWYEPGDPAGLFVMFRPGGFAPDDAPTDAGWVYASVTPEGEITGAGRMASCMDCHTEREDRLFGLPAEH